MNLRSLRLRHLLWTTLLATPALLAAGTLEDGTALAAEPAESLAPRTALDDYIARPDNHYEWSVVKQTRGKGFTSYVLDMKSQAWRTEAEVDRTVWQHWLVVVLPDRVAFDTGFLMIGGG